LTASSRSLNFWIFLRRVIGNSWPIDYLTGKNIVIVGGGFAFTMLRSLINYMLDERNRFRLGKITVIYGARTPGLLIYKENIITSLEMRMKCGRCNVGEKYVCKDGPVFSLAELDKLTKEY